MSLKERLKTNNVEVEIPAQKVEDKVSTAEETVKPQKQNKSYNDALNIVFKAIIETDKNILVCCPFDLPTFSAINYLCSKIPNDKRLVGIGSNLLLNPDEIIKFEPETQNQDKKLIKTALNLKPYKIVLQDFDGVEAVDVFKLINGGIKNIIGAVCAKDAKTGLKQAELNLYMAGINAPEKVVSPLILEFVDIIVETKNDGSGNCIIKDIFEVKTFEDGKDGDFNLISLLPQKAPEKENEPVITQKSEVITEPEKAEKAVKSEKAKKTLKNKKTVSTKKTAVKSTPKQKINKLLSKFHKEKISNK